ncbi:MAG: tRNA (adenosine(37)-N6)-threonylcarbamoyltransferase complex ATPase subunit type 1 TsaE [Oligoflexales bacterium]|nr:tRNA (adenosine(37)-N6)-threonylcarbamoyltransferase complex ATPase subunit type 1 TsaE [Oligoflexales bacterium]
MTSTENGKKLLFSEKVKLEKLSVIIKNHIIAQLWQEPVFVLWLDGNLGAGKTTVVRNILQQQGLSTATPVVSPTFTYINEYEIAGAWYAHLDLYRLVDNLKELEELDLANFLALDYRQYRGFFIEWPLPQLEKLGLAATHFLKIDMIPGKNKERNLAFWCGY